MRNDPAKNIECFHPRTIYRDPFALHTVQESFFHYSFRICHREFLDRCKLSPIESDPEKLRLDYRS